MARIVPDDWKNMEATGAAVRELDTLALLAKLPDDYTVYHGVHWTRINEGFSVFGEADFVVVAPSGRVLVIEQKAGFLRETPAGLMKVYMQKERNVAIQLARTLENLHRRFTAAFGAGTYRIEELLYCPDYTVKDASIAGVPEARIVDASRKGKLPSVVLDILPPDEPRFEASARIHHFLSDELALTPDTNALVGQADMLVTRLSGGLATWARRLEFQPFRLRVIGTAGSGKTQLAVQVMRDAVAKGRSVLYVCFNRPLADHIRLVAPPEARIANYHQLSASVTRDAGTPPDFSQPNVFATLEERFANVEIAEHWKFDVLIIDEGQDFQAAWVDALARLLKPDGAWWWLEDPMQNLYFRDPVPLPGWTTLRETTNYRSPRDLLAYIRRIVGREVRLDAGSPFDGSEVSLSTYENGHPDEVIEATKRAITQALALGYRKQDIAVLSFRGREGSVLTSVDQLGPHRLRSFMGSYDLFGNPEYREGDVLLESIYRFKGQSAPCVILTEVDFDTFDEQVARKFFVGATRATMKLIVVASERAAHAFDEQH
jgi:hypothetical protein